MSYITFAELPNPERKTKLWRIMGATELGTIKFFPAWRKYVFEPHSDTVFDVSCLDEIGAFLTEKTAEWRASL